MKTLKTEASKSTMKRILVGTDIRDGSPIHAEIAVDIEPDFSEGRTEFECAITIDGSVNGRKFDMRQGDKVFMNELEASVFKPYLK